MNTASPPPGEHVFFSLSYILHLHTLKPQAWLFSPNQIYFKELIENNGVLYLPSMHHFCSSSCLGFRFPSDSVPAVWIASFGKPFRTTGHEFFSSSCIWEYLHFWAFLLDTEFWAGRSFLHFLWPPWFLMTKTSHSNCCSPISNVCFLAAGKMCVSMFSNVVIMCLGMDFLVFILFGVHGGPSTSL